MVKRRSVNESSPNGNLRLPLPVQSWLWQITTPFIRSSKNASQTQLQRASTAQQFEVVLVQAQTRSQSPALCEALQSISRWRLIQAALPHVMHCAATILSEKFFTDDQMHKQGKFDANETKLLYTLHWILLDAASECEDNEDSNGRGGGAGGGASSSGGGAGTSRLSGTVAIDMPSGSGKPDGLAIAGSSQAARPSSQYIHSVCTVQLFVYLFAPLVMELREDQFLTLKLESGLRVWQAMWDFRSPEASCFSSLAKPRRSLLRGGRRLGANVAHIYIGKGTSMEQLEVPAVDLEADTSDYDLPSTLVGGEQPAPTANMSEICPLSAMSAETGADVEIVCELCQSVVYNRSGEFVGCKCNSSQRYSWTFADPRLKKKLKSPIDKEWIAQRLASVASSMPMGPVNPDLLSATLFDVAVLRCLFCLKWKEQGVYWALRYVHKRLLEVQRELERTQSEEKDRPRSRSLPLSSKPPPEASFGPLHTAASIGAFSQDSGGVDNVSACGVKKPRRVTAEEDGGGGVGGVSIGIGAGAAAGLSLNEFLATIASASSRRSSSGGDSDAPAAAAAGAAAGASGISEGGLNDSARFTLGRPSSRPVIKVNNSEDELSINSDNKSAVAAAAASGARIVHGALGSKSDSNIRYTDEEECEEEVPGSLFYIQENGHLNYSVILRAVYWVSKKHNKADICVVVMNILFVLLQLDVVERREAPPSEATGSSSGSRKQQLQQQKHSGGGGSRRRVDDSPASQPQQQQQGQGQDSSNGGGGRVHLFTNHSMAMDTLVRVIKCIGCTHGCMDSYTGSEADIVRAQIHACLGKLKQCNPAAFRAYLEQLVAGNSMQELVDILHAFTGFCMDPAVHTSPKPGGHHEQKNSYGTNFGQVGDGEGTRGSEGIVIASLLRPLLAKFVTHRKELASQENMPLYSDVRNLLNYLREVHGCTFRRTLLTGLLDCIQRRRRTRRDSGGAAGVGGANGDRPSRVSVASDNSDGAETGATKSPTSRAPSVTSESHRAAAAQRVLRGGGGGRCDRRSLSPFFTATSDSEGGAGGGGGTDRLGSPGSSDAEESPCRRRGGSGGVAPQRRRGFKSDTDDDSDKQNQVGSGRGHFSMGTMRTT